MQTRKTGYHLIQHTHIVPKDTKCASNKYGKYGNRNTQNIKKCRVKQQKTNQNNNKEKY